MRPGPDLRPPISITLYPHSACCWQQGNKLHDITSQKTVMIILVCTGRWYTTVRGLPVRSHGCGQGARCSGSQSQQSHEGTFF